MSQYRHVIISTTHLKIFKTLRRTRRPWLRHHGCLLQALLPDHGNVDKQNEGPWLVRSTGTVGVIVKQQTIRRVSKEVPLLTNSLWISYLRVFDKVKSRSAHMKTHKASGGTSTASPASTNKQNKTSSSSKGARHLPAPSPSSSSSLSSSTSLSSPFVVAASQPQHQQSLFWNITGPKKKKKTRQKQNRNVNF